MFAKFKLSVVVVWLVTPILAFAGDQTDNNEQATQDVDSQQSRWLGTKFVLLEPGEFSMGSDPSEKKRRDDESTHKVQISNSFMMSQKEITQKEYLRVMGLAPSWFSRTGGGKAKLETSTDDFPVDSVSWFDAIVFCNELSNRDSFPPYYEITRITKDQNSIASAEVTIKGGIGYRLPTEAEWEYACRAGSSTPYHFGEAKGTGRKGNFHYRRTAYSGSTNYALGRPTTVGSYKPNAWGLYDMHGNVAEWCWDVYDESYYDESPRADPLGPKTGSHRALRGGSFLVNETRCRSAARFWSFPGEGKFYTGFRVARTPAVDAQLSFKDYNLVFVSFDALQAAHVSCLGYPRKVTPAIDSIAARGFSFRNAASVSSWTVPSSMTWFTGVYPSEHRMVNKYAVYNPPETRIADLRDLSPHLVTLADVLKQHGYATGGFTGNAGVSGGFGYEQGFDTYYYVKGRFGRMDQSIPRALEWLRANMDNKFFLFLHGYDVHGQSAPPDGYDYRFVDKDYDRRYRGAELEQELLREEGLQKGALTMRDEDVRFWRAIYDEKIQRADARFKRFLDEFTRLGLMDKTIFVLTSDHGTEFFEHRRIDHGFSLYQELVHVPLIVQLPGRTTAVTIDNRVSSIDVMPTILDLLGIVPSDKVRRQLRGQSLVPAMQGEPVRRDVFSETNYREYTYKRSIIAPDGWKLIFTLEQPMRELYNLRNDPGETKDLSETNSDKADELERRLFEHFKSIGHDLESRSWPIGLNPVYPSQAR